MVALAVEVAYSVTSKEETVFTHVNYGYRQQLCCKLRLNQRLRYYRQLIGTDWPSMYHLASVQTAQNDDSR